MTDEELDRLFRDAAESFRNSNPPEGAWEAFYIKNAQELKDKGAAPVEDLDKKNAPFIWAKSYKVAASLLILFAACAIVWLIVSNQTTDGVIASKQPEPNTPIDTAAALIVDIAKDTNCISPRPFLNEAGPSVAAGHLTDASNKNPDDQPPPVVNGEGNNSSNAGKNTVILPMAVLPEQKDNSITPHAHQGDRKKIDLVTDPGGNSNKDNYTTNNLFATGKEPQKRSSSGRWQLGLVGGTNIAMVRGDVSSTPGLNTGILVQHRINDSRVSIESGVIYENMTYAVENEYFNPGGKPVSSKVSNISGSCTMIDVPVNVRYDMVHSKKRKAFVSTGVSPTVMVKQSYVYDYTDENGTRLIDRDVTGQGKNFYAVANVSVGYEQKWNKTSVQVAPYLKIPMSEIGYGNLSLGGIGTQVSIKRDL